MSTSEQRTRLPSRLVWTRFGISERTLERWVADPLLKFPKPMLIRRRRYYFLDEIEEWERAEARRNAVRASGRAA
jgi:hypothetical protein